MELLFIHRGTVVVRSEWLTAPELIRTATVASQGSTYKQLLLTENPLLNRRGNI